MTLRVLDPTFDSIHTTEEVVPRLPSLSGRTVGLLDNSKLNVDTLLDHVEELLRSQHGVSTVIRLHKPDASVRLRMTSLKVSQRAMRSFPRSVIEAAVHRAVCTMPYRRKGWRSCHRHYYRSLCPDGQSHGHCPGSTRLPFCYYSPPIASNTEATLREKAADAVRQCVDMLLQGEPHAGT